MHLGPDQVLLNLDLEFQRDLTMAELRQAIARLEEAIRRAHPEITRVYLKARSLGETP
jgi:hypothetical protein